MPGQGICSVLMRRYEWTKADDINTEIQTVAGLANRQTETEIIINENMVESVMTLINLSQEEERSKAYWSIQKRWRWYSKIYYSINYNKNLYFSFSSQFVRDICFVFQAPTPDILPRNFALNWHWVRDRRHGRFPLWTRDSNSCR